MSQTITIPKTIFAELINRLNRLEAAVFGKKKGQFPVEYVVLSERAKKRYKRMGEDFKKGRNFYVADNVEGLLKELKS